MRKIVVTLAPVASKTPEGVVVPIDPLDPLETAIDVISAAEASASMVHLHVINQEGQISEGLSRFSKTLDYIREKSDIVIQGSTGGLSSLSREERCVAIEDARVEVASLNMGSVNKGNEVSINKLPDIRYWAKRMHEKNIRPELEIFEAGMINNVLLLAEEGLIKPPFYFNFALVTKGSQPVNVDNLFYLKNLLPDNSIWGFVHHNMQDLSLLATAIGMGASVVRCGFEDSIYYAPGKKATRNVELVKRVVKMIRSMGLEVATPIEAKEILGIF